MTEGPPGPGGRKPLPALPGAVALMTMGTTVAGCVAAGVVAGVAVDDAWGLSPWGLLVGLALGLVAGVASAVKLVQRWL